MGSILSLVVVLFLHYEREISPIIIIIIISHNFPTLSSQSVVTAPHDIYICTMVLT